MCNPMNSGRTILITLLICCYSALSAQQDILISAQFKNESLSHILNKLGNEYNIDFAFDSYELSRIYGSWEFESIALSDVLKSLLKSKNLSYKWLDETIIIYQELKIETITAEKIDSDSVSIRGEVRDFSSRELLPFSVLSMRSAFNDFVTDGDGKFILQFPFDVNDTLQVFFVGYEVGNIPVKDLVNKDFVTVFLTPARNYLPAVLIEAQSKQSIESSTASGLYIINPGSITTMQGTGEADLLRTAQLLPGITATQESSNGLYIRGGNNDQTLLSFDGFNIYHQDHFFGAFTAINSNAVKAMSIQKGMTDVRFGGRVAGVVEIIGKEGNLKKSSSQIDVGPLSIGAAIESPTDSLGKSSIFITARRAFTNAVFSPTYRQLFNTTYNAAVTTNSGSSTDAFKETKPAFYFQDFNLKFTYRPTTRDVVNFSCYASKDDLFVQYADSSDSQLDNTRDVKYTDESNKKNLGTSLRWGRIWDNRWESNLNIGLSRFTGDFFAADSIRELLFMIDSVRFTSEKSQLKDFDGRFEMKKVISGNKVVAGAQINSISSGIKNNEMGTILLDSVSRGVVLSTYISAENETNERLKLKPGLRINYYNRSGDLYFEPRINMLFEAVKNRLRLKASAGRVHQYIQRIQSQNLYQNTPDYWQLADSGGIGVMRSDQVMAGLVLTNKQWTLDVEGYYKSNEGNAASLSAFTNSITTSDNTLNGSGKAYGVDVLLSKYFKRHHFLISYSLLKAEADYFYAGLKNVPEIFEQRHEIKLNYEINLKHWDFAIFWVYGSGRPYTPVLGTYDFSLPDGNTRKLPVYGELNSARLPAYHRLDVTAAWHFLLGKAKGSIQFSVFNAYNQKNIGSIQYLTVRNSIDPNDFSVAKRSVNMLGFLPSINLKLKF